MQPYRWIVVAAAWATLATQLVLESARAGRGLVLFGQLLADPGPGWTLVIVAAVAASAAVAMCAAVGDVRGRRLERRMAAELDARWDELARIETEQRERRDQLAGRVAGLHRQLEALMRERAEIEQHVQAERLEARSIRTSIHRTARSLDQMLADIDGVVAVPEAEEVAVPETEERVTPTSSRDVRAPSRRSAARPNAR